MLRSLLLATAAVLVAAAPVHAGTLVAYDCAGPNARIHDSNQRTWDLRTGSMVRRSGTCVPSNGTFRVVSLRSFGDIRIESRGKVQGWNPQPVVAYRPPGEPAAPALFGVLYQLRWASQNELYYVAFARKPDVRIEIFKKVPRAVVETLPAEQRSVGRVSASVVEPDGRGVQNGVYYLLADAAVPYRVGASWQRWTSEIVTTTDGRSVRIRLWINRTLVLEAWDNGERGGPALTTPGRVGYRSDNANWLFDDVHVTSVPRISPTPSPDPTPSPSPSPQPVPSDGPFASPTPTTTEPTPAAEPTPSAALAVESTPPPEPTDSPSPSLGPPPTALPAPSANDG